MDDQSLTKTESKLLRDLRRKKNCDGHCQSLLHRGHEVEKKTKEKTLVQPWPIITIAITTTTTAVSPFYRTICISWHHQPRTAGFCCSKVLEAACLADGN